MPQRRGRTGTIHFPPEQQGQIHTSTFEYGVPQLRMFDFWELEVTQNGEMDWPTAKIPTIRRSIF